MLFPDSTNHRKRSEHSTSNGPFREVAVVTLLMVCVSVTSVSGYQDIEWPTSMGEPVQGAARTPNSKSERERWLTNMVAHHGFSLAEVKAATGLESDDIVAEVRRLGIHPFSAGEVAEGLRVLPYPGGRHPRTGFLDGAVRPQRETKFSIFLPWDHRSYVVADIPEAIWSNLGLTYLAHTHIDTVWDAQKIKLQPMEWQRTAAEHLWLERRLPNGLAFGTESATHDGLVMMRMWLRNGTSLRLSDLRVQNCIMLKAAPGFDDETNENKRFRGAYVACHDTTGTRWIITAWQPIHRAWANPPCPCLHADPRFPDVDPGETEQLVGMLSFYEGDDIERELQRLQSKGWETYWKDQPLPRSTESD